MPLPYMQFLFPDACPRQSGEFVTCVIRYATSTGMFLELRFPLKHIACALGHFLIIFVSVKYERCERLPLCPLPPCPTMARGSHPDPITISRHRAVSKQAPRLATNKSFTFWQRRTHARKPKCLLTVGDRLVQAKKHEQHRRECQDALEEAHAMIRGLAEGLKNRFGKYSVDHYFNDLIHRAHRLRLVRRVSGWNAYQKCELERMKSKLVLIFIVDSLRCALLGEAGDNASQINLTEVNKQISENWKALSPTQCEDITAEWIKKIEEQREGKKLVAHSVPLNAFHDARSTIQSVETQVR